MPTNKLHLVRGWLALVIFAGFTWGDLYLQGVGEDHARAFKHDRFYAGADRAFIGESLDLSGVGQATSGGWVTMISPTYFLSAAHAHPKPGSTVIFWEGNSRTEPAQKHTYVVDHWSYQTSHDGQGTKGLGSDLWLGRLTQPLKPQDKIAFYPVLKLPEEARYIGLKLYVLGQPYKLGLSTLDKIVDDLEIGKTRALRYGFHEKPGTGLGESECYLLGGDSGGPTFTVVNGKLVLLGIHFTNNTSNGLPDPEDPHRGWSGDSFVPYYLDQLNAHMGTERVTTPPESPAPVSPDVK